MQRCLEDVISKGRDNKEDHQVENDMGEEKCESRGVERLVRWTGKPEETGCRSEGRTPQLSQSTALKGNGPLLRTHNRRFFGI
ncbi:hypothetical protein Aduo_016104 [Ancylostoma duodenale]